MGKSSTKILIFFESALNALKKSDLVQKILDLKGKIIVDTDLHKLSNQIHKPSEAISLTGNLQVNWLSQKMWTAG